MGVVPVRRAILCASASGDLDACGVEWLLWQGAYFVCEECPVRIPFKARGSPPGFRRAEAPGALRGAARGA
jgi:hypothetical protein